MFGAILKATNSSFQKGITFCRSIYVKKVMKLLAFIFEQPSYTPARAILRLLKARFNVVCCALLNVSVSKSVDPDETSQSSLNWVHTVYLYADICM